MAEVAITLKLHADEFQTLRDELKAHKEHLDAVARTHGESGAHGQKHNLLSRSAKVAFLLEKLG